MRPKQILEFGSCSVQKKTLLPVADYPYGWGWGRDDRRRLWQVKAFDVEEPDLDLSGQEELDVLGGLAAHHVSPEQSVEGVAPGTDVMIFKIFSPKNLAFLTQNRAKF
jgi:hypothetical protein